MPKYYCDYCKTYLTHDSTSVRKSHLIGKNHIKYVCDYYELEAKKLGLWDFEDTVSGTSLDDIYQGAPGMTAVKLEVLEEEENTQSSNAKTSVKNVDLDDKNEASNKLKDTLPSVEIYAPPTLANLPNPPPSLIKYPTRPKKTSNAFKHENLNASDSSFKKFANSSSKPFKPQRSGPYQRGGKSGHYNDRNSSQGQYNNRHSNYGGSSGNRYGSGGVSKPYHKQGYGNRRYNN